MDLHDLTKQESGIIIFTDNTVVVCNWDAEGCGDNEMPLMSPIDGMLMPWDEGEEYFNGADKYKVDDIRKELTGSVWLTGEKDADGTPLADTDMEIAYDKNNDLVRLFTDTTLTEKDYVGTVYVLQDCTKIIAPYMWN